MLTPFRVYEPESVEDACAFLADTGHDSAVYAGGTELLLAMKERLLAPAYLVDVKRIGLGGVSLDAETGELRLGATATHREIETWARSGADWQALAELEGSVANVRVRNQGTIGGNLCFGEPHADPGTLLTLWDATVELADRSGKRRLPIGGFFVDEFETALEEDEVMTAILIPRRPVRSASAYLRFGFLERPTLGVAALIALEPDGRTVGEARIALGAVGPHPERAEPAGRALVGAEIEGASWERAVALAAADAAETCTISEDGHASEEYKRHLVGVHVRRTLDVCRIRVLSTPANGEAA